MIITNEDRLKLKEFIMESVPTEEGMRASLIKQGLYKGIKAMPKAAKKTKVDAVLRAGKLVKLA